MIMNGTFETRWNWVQVTLPSYNAEPTRIGQWRHDCFPYDILWYKGIQEGEEKMVRMTEWQVEDAKTMNDWPGRWLNEKMVQDPAAPNPRHNRDTGVIISLSHQEAWRMTACNKLQQPINPMIYLWDQWLIMTNATM